MTPISTETVILPCQLPRTAWGNGAGYTREIAISTPTEPGTPSDYRWRLSLADLTQPAPFSSLPGIDRVFTLASAGPLTMTLGGDVVTLRLGQTVEFEGEVHVAAGGSIDEPQLGLNLMMRRSVCTGSMRIVRVNGPTLLDPTAGVVAATVLQGAGTLPDGKNIDNMATLVLGASALKVQGEGCLLAIATVQAA